MSLDFAEAGFDVINNDKIDEPRLEERVLRSVQRRRILQHADRVLFPAFAAERERKPEDQQDRHHDVPRERASIPQEFAIACDENGIDALEHGSHERSE